MIDYSKHLIFIFLLTKGSGSQGGAGGDIILVFSWAFGCHKIYIHINDQNVKSKL